MAATVKVLVSHGYGAGWSSWATTAQQGYKMAHDAGLVALVLGDASREQLKAYAETVYPTEYCNGAGELDVVEVPVGADYRITEFDGSESLEVLNRNEWWRAL